MKATRSLLFGLAGAWIIVLFMDKIMGTAAGIRSKRTFLPLRMVYYGLRSVKSLVLLGLVIMNVFLAISLVGRNDGAQKGCC
jgi:hypothetical protein